MKHYSFTDILGPIMIGPSSSHTAGAAKLGLVAKCINNKPFTAVVFQLHGSFAKTYKGHGTDKALIGGILGFEPDDMRLRDSYDYARDLNIPIRFEEVELDTQYANTVRIIFHNKDSSINQITGSSIGGGDIIINAINDFKVSFKGQYPTLIVKHMDKKGVLSLITTILATSDINIASMEVSRTSKNKQASIIIECDEAIDHPIIELIKAVPDVLSVKNINVKKEMPMYKSAEDFIRLAHSESIVQIILQKEYSYFNKDAMTVYNSLEKILHVMLSSARKAIDEPDNYHGHLIGGDAKKMDDYKNADSYTGSWLVKAMSHAFSSSEVNASMGKICAAPTAGSCGILPATLITAKEQMSLKKEQMFDGLLVASMIGELITLNATVSGAEGGCQAECGSAAAMAAGMLVYFKKGTIEQIFDAGAIALKNVMGLVCDPIAGLVESPCAKRNASGVVNAMISADMALAGVTSIVPFDEVVSAMYKVGKALPSTLKETALGGIAITKTGQELNKKIMKSDV